MNERIGKLAVEAGAHWDHGDWNMPSAVYFSEGDLEKFAELIVRECTAALFDESERLSGLYSDEDNWDSAEEYEIRSNQCIDDIALIEKHFGVEE
jgi:hypothetical protein